MSGAKMCCGQEMATMASVGTGKFYLCRACEHVEHEPAGTGQESLLQPAPYPAVESTATAGAKPQALEPTLHGIPERELAGEQVKSGEALRDEVDGLLKHIARCVRDDRKPDIRAADLENMRACIRQSQQRIESLEGALRDGYRLSTLAAAIQWNDEEPNTMEFLEDLYARINRVQAQFKKLLPDEVGSPFQIQTPFDDMEPDHD